MEPHTGAWTVESNAKAPQTWWTHREYTRGALVPEVRQEALSLPSDLLAASVLVPQPSVQVEQSQLAAVVGAVCPQCRVDSLVKQSSLRHGICQRTQNSISLLGVSDAMYRTRVH